MPMTGRLAKSGYGTRLLGEPCGKQPQPCLAVTVPIMAKFWQSLLYIGKEPAILHHDFVVNAHVGPV